ncbi:MAG: hypothetical protein ACR2PQ_03980, partial [Myxococcota bacterium]
NALTGPVEQSFEGAGESNLSIAGMTEQSNVAFGGPGEPVVSAIGAASLNPTGVFAGSAVFTLTFTTTEAKFFQLEFTGQATGTASYNLGWCPGGVCDNRANSDFTTSGLLQPGTHLLQVSAQACGDVPEQSRRPRGGACIGLGQQSATYGFSLVVLEPELEPTRLDE